MKGSLLEVFSYREHEKGNEEIFGAYVFIFDEQCYPPPYLRKVVNYCYQADWERLVGKRRHQLVSFKSMFPGGSRDQEFRG